MEEHIENNLNLLVSETNAKLRLLCTESKCRIHKCPRYFFCEHIFYVKHEFLNGFTRTYSIDFPLKCDKQQDTKLQWEIMQRSYQSAFHSVQVNRETSQMHSHHSYYSANPLIGLHSNLFEVEIMENVHNEKEIVLTLNHQV